MAETQLPELNAAGTRERWPIPIWVAAGIFAVLSIAAAVTSKGFLEADACTHFLSASFGFKQPSRFLGVWDRPLFMLIYTPAAALAGTTGARMMSLAMALLCGWCAWRIAARLGVKRPELAMIFTLGQPLLFLHSFAELTELCFAAVIGLAFLAFMDRRWGWMALLVAISPLGRPEGFGFIVLAALVFVAYRQWKWLLVLPCGLLIWTFIGWLMWDRPDYGWGWASFLRWLPRQWPYSGASVYDAGPLLLWKLQPNGSRATSFLMKLPSLIGPLLFPFMLIGTGLMLRGWRRDIGSHSGRCKLAAVLLPWGVLACHSLLWWRGLMASNGELRYLLVTAPLWGVIGTWGFSFLDCFCLSIGKRVFGPAAVAGILALSPALFDLHYRVVPLPLYEDDLLSKQVAAWYSGDAQLREKYPRLTASYIAVYLYLQYSPTDWEHTVTWGKRMVAQRPKGVVLVWDEINGTRNADANLCVSEQEIRDSGWMQIHQFERGGRVWKAFVQPE